VPERLPGLDLSGECEKCRPHAVVQGAVGDDHVEDGLRSELVPDPDGFEQPAGGGNNGGRARIAACAGERGIGDHNRDGRAQALAQCDRQCEADNARAGDQHIHMSGSLRRWRHDEELLAAQL
jgi:hypothetical protein